MEVMSIADYERERAHELDYHIESAVDQLVALSQPDMPQTLLTEVIRRFGEFQLDEDGYSEPFGFNTPTTCRKWPGPHYGATQLHKVIAKPPSKPKPKSRERPREVVCRQQQRVQVVTARRSLRARSRDQTSHTPPNSTVSFKSSLRLMDVPAEIRNLIWSLLATRDEPVEAQLRSIQSSKKLHGRRRKIVRRFPQEPLVAQTNKQIRKEVLSIFYGTNRFVFERNACHMFRGLSMLRLSNMQRWKPLPDLAEFLARVDMRFNAHPRDETTMISIVYILRKTADAKATIAVRADRASPSLHKKNKRVYGPPQYCLCEEKAVIAEVDLSTASNPQRDLVDLAMTLVKKRNDKMFGRPFSNFYPPSPLCERCGRDTFEIVCNNN